MSRRTPALKDTIYLIKPGDDDDDEKVGDTYYSVDAVTDIVTVEKTTPDTLCLVTVEYKPNEPNIFYLKTRKGVYFQFPKKTVDHIDHTPEKKRSCFKKKREKRRISFTLIEQKEPDIFVFRAVNVGRFLTLDVNEEGCVVLGGFDSAKIRVGDPAIKRHSGGLDYSLEEAQLLDLTPEVVFNETVRNDSQTEFTQALNYTYVVSHVGSWTTSIETPVPSEVVGGSIPCLVDGEIIIAGRAALGSETKERKEGVKLVSIKANTRGVAKVLIFRALIKVPFTFIESVWYRNGEYTDTTKYGTYSNTVTYGVDVEITDSIELTHTIQ